MKAHGITIYLIQNDSVDLKEILEAIGEKGKEGYWKILNLDCIGKSAETLLELSDERKQIPGQEFHEMFSGVTQTIEGECECYKQDAASPWILIRAVDGTEFDIETEDLELLETFRRRFNGVRDLVD